MTAPSPDTLVLIDGHALAYRSYFALPPLHNSRGEATHAVLGFLRHALRIARQASNQVIVVFDPPGGTFRHEQYGGYKSGRAQTPDDLPAQIDRIRALVDALGWPRLEEPGFEADDVIATLTKMAEGKGFQVRIVTSDRDAYQLLDDHVRVLASDFSLVGPEDVLAKYGVTVGQWVDYRALTGDASDNIPGAKGIGPKTAAKLLQEYGTLDAVLAAARAGTLEPRSTREKLLVSEADVLFSRELSCMVTNLPLKVELGVPRGPGDPARLEALLDELELASLKKDLLGLARGTPETGPDTPTRPDSFQPPEIAEWRTPGPEVTWGYVLSREDDLTADLIAAATFDGQVARVAPVEERVGSTAEAVAVLDAAAPEGPLFRDPQADEAPRKLTRKEQQAAERATKAAQKAAERRASLFPPIVSEAEFVGQREVTAAGAKALAAHLSVRGTVVEPGDDPLLVAYLLDPANTNMPIVAERYLRTTWPEDAASRAAIAYRLLRDLLPQLDEARRKLYEDVEKPLSGVLKRMEVCGVRLDSDYLRGLSG
ncbi:MAG: 5'-3' exonuclease H3TH domain-containing protein, partial [Deinococcota bacterium]